MSAVDLFSCCRCDRKSDVSAGRLRSHRRHGWGPRQEGRLRRQGLDQRGSAKKGDSVTEDLIAGVSAKKGDSTARKSDSAIEGLIAAGMSYVCSTARRLVWHVV
jgi:hypothetical protein